VDKEKSQGQINICFVYSCYDNDANGNEVISAQRIGGISVTVDLPMTSKFIVSPLRSIRGSDYWMMFWMSRVPLWCRASIHISELALDARIFSNNQSLEGGINQAKNLTSTVKEDMSELSALVLKRWDDCFESGRLLFKQLREAGES